MQTAQLGDPQPEDRGATREPQREAGFTCERKGWTEPIEERKGGIALQRQGTDKV